MTHKYHTNWIRTH